MDNKNIEEKLDDIFKEIDIKIENQKNIYTNLEFDKSIDYWKPWKYDENSSIHTENIIIDSPPKPKNYNINIKISEEKSKHENNYDLKHDFLKKLEENTLEIENLKLSLMKNIAIEPQKNFKIEENIQKPKYDHKNICAIKIQSRFRSFIIRSKYLFLKEKWIMYKFKNTFLSKKREFIKKNARKILEKHLKMFSEKLALRKKLIYEKFMNHCCLMIQSNYRKYQRKKFNRQKKPIIYESQRKVSIPDVSIKIEQKPEKIINLSKQNENNENLLKKNSQNNNNISQNKWEERENMVVGGKNRNKNQDFTNNMDDYFPSKAKENDVKTNKNKKDFLKKNSLSKSNKKTNKNLNLDVPPPRNHFRKKSDLSPTLSEKQEKNIKKTPSKTIKKGDVTKDSSKKSSPYLKRVSKKVINGEKLDLNGVPIKVDCWLHKKSPSAKLKTPLINNINNNPIININFNDNLPTNNQNLFIEIPKNSFRNEEKSTAQINRVISMLPEYSIHSINTENSEKIISVEDLERAYRTNYYTKLTNIKKNLANFNDETNKYTVIPYLDEDSMFLKKYKSDMFQNILFSLEDQYKKQINMFN